MAGSFSDVTVIIPTLNESANIRAVLEALSRQYAGIRILVVDDNSSDGTAEAVMRFSKKHASVRLLSRKGKARGLTASIIDGIRKASTKYVVVMDGDFQHPPEKIREIAGMLRSGHPIVVACRRRVDDDWPAHRKLMSKGAEMLGRARLSASGSATSSDLLSGFFGAKRRLALETYERNKGRFVPEGYKFLFDLLKCLPKGTKLCETGYVFGERKGGKSKIGSRQCIAFLKSLAR